jgi:hypothetical protein
MHNLPIIILTIFLVYFCIVSVRNICFLIRCRKLIEDTITKNETEPLTDEEVTAFMNHPDIVKLIRYSEYTSLLQ